MTNLDALKELAEAAGATDVDGIDNNLDALNATAKALGGTGESDSNADAFYEIAQNFSGGGGGGGVFVNITEDGSSVNSDKNLHDIVFQYMGGNTVLAHLKVVERDVTATINIDGGITGATPVYDKLGTVIEAFEFTFCYIYGTDLRKDKYLINLNGASRTSRETYTKSS